MGANGKRSRLRLAPDEYHKLRLLVFERDNWKCKVCRLRKELHAHHIKYRTHGGDDATWNLLSVCNECHDAIHDRKVIILPKNGKSIIVSGRVIPDPVNADEGVQVMFIDGWKPRTKVK